MFSFFLCALALQPMLDSAGPSYREKLTRPGGSYEMRFGTCVAIVEEAEGMNVPPALAVSVAMSESKLNPEAVSSAGALGPLQVIPRYNKPPKNWKDEDPFLIRHGVATLLKFLFVYGCEVEIDECLSVESRPDCEAKRYAIARRNGEPIEGCSQAELFEALCHYNGGGGKCGTRPKRYARNIIKRAWTFEASLSFLVNPLPLFSSTGVHSPHADALVGPRTHWTERYIRDHCERCPDCCVRYPPAKGER